MSEWYDTRTGGEVFSESQQARDAWDAFHAYESDTTIGGGDRFTVAEGDDSEFRITDQSSSLGPEYVVGADSGQPWHHWIESIALAYCAALNEGKAIAP